MHYLIFIHWSNIQSKKTYRIKIEIYINDKFDMNKNLLHNQFQLFFGLEYIWSSWIVHEQNEKNVRKFVEDFGDFFFHSVIHFRMNRKLIATFDFALKLWFHTEPINILFIFNILKRRRMCRWYFDLFKMIINNTITNEIEWKKNKRLKCSKFVVFEMLTSPWRN